MQDSIFVKIDEYRDIIDILNLTKEKLKEAQKTLETIEHMKNQEDSEIENWKSEIDEVEKRLESISKNFNEIENG